MMTDGCTGSVEALNQATLKKLAGGARDKDTMVVLYAPWCPFCKGLEEDYEAVAKDIGGKRLRVAKYNADADREYSESLGLQTFPTLIFLPKNTEKVRLSELHWSVVAFRLAPKKRRQMLSPQAGSAT